MASLSARRAWIEIIPSAKRPRLISVALRKESVDRNDFPVRCSPQECASLSARRAWIEIRTAEMAKTSNAESLSARRAWIEMYMWRSMHHCVNVALRKESVDRNRRGAGIAVPVHGRSPQGERG